MLGNLTCSRAYFTIIKIKSGTCKIYGVIKNKIILQEEIAI